MGFMDLIRELRTGDPDVKKAANTMKYIGWFCLFGGVWNFTLPQLMPFDKAGFHIPASYPYAALVGFAVVGGLFLYAARGIRELEPWGKKAGQAAILLLMAEVVIFFAMVFPDMPDTDGTFRIISRVFFAIAMAQFVVPAYFGLRYLGRLPTRRDPYDSSRYNPDEITRALSERMNERTGARPGEPVYKDSPMPFGILGTFLLLIGPPMLLVIAVQRYAGLEAMGVMIPFVVLIIFTVPPIFNYLPSPFQQHRKLIASFTGGGSIYLFNGSWPFFRVMVYEDALEVRFMLHRFLIPYDRMDDIPDTVGFFSTGILIRSDLPDVPSRIRFSGFGMKKIAQTMHDARRAFTAAAPTMRT